MVKIKDTTMFWGVTLDGGKRYTQTVERSFHVSMASLEPKMELSSSPSKNVRRPISVMIVHDKAEFIMCTVEQGRCYQQPLDLNFTEGEEITLFLNGDGVVHLTGYLIDDSQFSEADDEDVFDEEEDIEDESDEAIEDEEEEESDDEIPQLTQVKDAKRKKRKDGKKKKASKNVVEKLRFEEEEDEASYDYDDYAAEDQEDETESEEDVPKKFIKSEQLKDYDEDTNDSTLDTNEDAEQIQSFVSRKGKGKQPKLKAKSAQQKMKKAMSPLRETVQQGFATQTQESNEIEPKKKKRKRKNKQARDIDDSTQPRTSADYPSEVKTIQIKKRVFPGGIKMEEIKTGHGPHATIGKTLHVYYTGRLGKNGDVFDSKTSGKPFTFRLGKGEVIKGWDIAFDGLRVGGKRRLSIPPSLGYGGMQAGPIPPNSTLLFDVELKAVS